VAASAKLAAVGEAAVALSLRLSGGPAAAGAGAAPQPTTTDVSMELSADELDAVIAELERALGAPQAPAAPAGHRAAS
jgi:hypothetical protein